MLQMSHHHVIPFCYPSELVVFFDALMWSDIMYDKSARVSSPDTLQESSTTTASVALLVLYLLLVEWSCFCSLYALGSTLRVASSSMPHIHSNEIMLQQQHARRLTASQAQLGGANVHSTCSFQQKKNNTAHVCAGQLLAG